jgi:acetolactate synthase-1/2/3 large subunit
VPFDVNIFADAKLFIQLLTDKIRKLESAIDVHQSWTKRVIAWKNKYDPVRPEYYEENKHVHPYVFMRKLSEILPDDAILVGDCGGNIIISNHAFQTKFGQRNLTNNGNSPMGFSFSGAIGACLATNSPVICTIGDGGFCMNIQEMQTLLNYKIKLKTFILNNQIYGITKAYQETNFEGRAEACGPKGYHPPDFSKIAEAYGIYVVEIENNAQIEKKIEEVLEYDGPVICNVKMPEYHTYEPKIIGWETPIEDMYPYLSREEFIENMMIDPVDGWKTPFMPDVE